MWIQFLGWEHPLEEGMATCSSSCLEKPMDRGAWQATVHSAAELDMTEVTQHAHVHSLTYMNVKTLPDICVCVFNCNVKVAFLRNLILLRNVLLKNSFRGMKGKTDNNKDAFLQKIE